MKTFFAKKIIQLFRRWPFVFTVSCVAGVVIGVFLALSEEAPSDFPFKLLGICMIVFYFGLLLMQITKLRRGTWSESCDWWESRVRPFPGGFTAAPNYRNAQIRSFPSALSADLLA